MLHALAAAVLALAPLQDPPPIDFAGLGGQFVAEHCPAGAGAPCKLDEVLANGFAHLEIGPYQVHAPTAMLGEKQGVEHLRRVTQALAKSIEQWAAWQGAEGAIPANTGAAWASFTGRWKALKPAELKRATSSDLLDLFAANDAERAMVKELEAACDDGTQLALTIPTGRQLRLILVPTRLEFLQFAGYSGLVDESLQAVNWMQGADQWTQFWLGWDLVLALEYAPWEGYDPTFKSSTPMDKVGPGILAQHIVQQAFFGLLRSCKPQTAEARFETALAMVMTIEACGEINTVENAGGVSSSGAKTNPYSRFIPGGNSKGGTLPGRSSKHLSMLVESRWRRGHGKDGFASALKAGQIECAKASKGIDHADPSATFVLHQEDGTGKHFIHAPFFGPHADAQEYPPGEYLVDYAEFYRAYKTGFFHWLAHEGVDPKAPQAKWNELIRALPGVQKPEEFDALVEKVYGLPISAKDGSTDSLEWRFLKFVTKSKPT